MKAELHPSTLAGTITAPASKSAMQRACAAALIRKGKSILTNPGVSNDDKAALNIIQQLGANVSVEEGKVIIESKGVQPVSDSIDCHESGLSIRMFTSIAAVSAATINVNGSGSLAKRPMHFFDEVLPQLQVQCNSRNGHLPLTIQGPLQPKDITVNGSLSSQYITGLLMAYAATEAEDVTITVNDLNSRPYIDLTLQLLQSFGLKVPQNKHYEQFYYGPEIEKISNEVVHYAVEGDWSNAAFLLVGGALSGDMIVNGMDLQSVQGDKAILDVLQRANATINIERDAITISSSDLKAFEFDATDCPDLFPPLVALAAYAKGTTSITGVHRLTHKESNRAATLQDEFGKMGVNISFTGDQMLIEGGNGVNKAVVSSHNDHRIAMACAVAGLKASGTIIIHDAQAVNKSYPNFWQDIQQLGAQLSLTD